MTFNYEPESLRLAVVSIKSAVSLLHVVEMRLKIVRHTGNKHFAICPFHSEKTPSFCINDEEDFFYCFGCGAKGDVITFVSKYDNLSFVESVLKLANMLGIVVSEASETKNFTQIYQLLERVCNFYEQNLNNEILSYLDYRGINIDSIRKFRVGFAPDFGIPKFTQSYPKDILISSGLLTNSLKEYFRLRIMFPIMDVKSRVIGFGGRAASETKIAKYLNSPDSNVFHKGKILYGLQNAISSIKKNNICIVVEGYLDVIAMHQHGFKNTVANLGTSVTLSQIAMITRLTNNIIFCFDGDVAGIKAMERVAFLILEELSPRVVIKFALLPLGQDPCDFLKNSTENNLMSILDKAIPHYQFLFDNEVKKIDKQIDKQSMTVSSFITLEYNLFENVSKIKNSIVASNYKAFFKSEIYKLRGTTFFSKRIPQKIEKSLSKKELNLDVSEYDLMQCLLIFTLCKYPYFLNETNEVLLNKITFKHTLCKKIIICLLKNSDEFCKLKNIKESVICIKKMNLLDELRSIFKGELTVKYLFDRQRFNNKEFAEINFQLILIICELNTIVEMIYETKIMICKNDSTLSGESLNLALNSLEEAISREKKLQREEKRIREIIKAM